VNTGVYTGINMYRSPQMCSLTRQEAS